MKKLLQTIAMSITLGLGVWSLAVTFAPVTSNFLAGQQVSATAFNDLFAAINSNFNAAKTAIEASESAIAANTTAIAETQTVLSTLTSPPAVSVHSLTDQTVANNTLLRVAFNAELFDTDDLHSNDTNNSRLTLSEAGLYQISVMSNWSLNTSGSRTVIVRKNGVAAPVLADVRGAIDGGIVQSFSGLLNLEAGDFLEVFVFQDSGAPLTISSTVPLVFSLHKVGELP